MTITDITPAVIDVRGLTEDELFALAATDQDAAIAEAERRDRADQMAKARRALDTVRAEGERQAYAQYRQADEWCRGVLLSKAGEAAGITDEQVLWRIPWDDAQQYASEELGLFWLHVSPRVTAREYVRQQAAERRRAQAEARDNRGGNDEELDRAQAGALRRGTAASQAPQGGTGGTVRGSGHSTGTGEAGDGTRADRRAGRPVRGHGTGGDMGVVTAGVRAYQRHDREQARRAADVAVPVSGTVTRPRGVVAHGAPVPGDQLLDLVRDNWLGWFARYPSAAALDAVTLWAAHTHMRDENGRLVFRATPRLYLLSSEPGSGKGRVLELLMPIVPDCFGLDLEPTMAGLVHTINREHATVLLDEGDILLGAGNRKEGVRAVINGGTYHHGTVLNGKGAKATRTPVFGPIALAGLDVMEKATGDTLKALLSRGVKIRMEKASGEDRPPRMTSAAEEAAPKIQYWLSRWAGQVRAEVKDADPEVPEGLEGRAEDIWVPLLAVANAAGGTWPARALAACRELALAEPDSEDMADEFAEFAASFA